MPQTCTEFQFHAETHAADQLDPALAVAVRRHLAECTDCRVQHQRTRRLIALLQLKRHEQPPPGYFENFLTEFHRRQQTAAQPVWRRVFLPATVPIPFTSTFKWALSGACGIGLVAGLIWLSWVTNRDALQSSTAVGIELRHEYVASPATPSPLASRSPTVELTIALDSRADDPGLVDGLLTASSLPVRNQPTVPRYVLDRIPVTTVRFDPSADF